MTRLDIFNKLKVKEFYILRSKEHPSLHSVSVVVSRSWYPVVTSKQAKPELSKDSSNLAV